MKTKEKKLANSKVGRTRSRIRRKGPIPAHIQRTWWWRQPQPLLTDTNRRSAIFYEFWARLKARGTKPQYFGQLAGFKPPLPGLDFVRSWPDLTPRERLVLAEIWPTSCDPEVLEYCFRKDAITNALNRPSQASPEGINPKRTTMPGWSSWILIKVNYAKDRNEILEHFDEALSELAEEDGLIAHAPNKWKLPRQLLFTCVEAQDLRNAQIPISDSDEHSIRTKKLEYVSQITEGIKRIERREFKVPDPLDRPWAFIGEILGMGYPLASKPPD